MRGHVPALAGLLTVAVVLGACIGATVYLFLLGFDHLLDLLWDDIPSRTAWTRDHRDAYVIALCVIGGLIVGLLQRFLADEPSNLRAALKRMASEGTLGHRHLAAVAVVSIVSLGFGGALGPEAPLIVIISGLASLSSRTLKLSLVRARDLSYMAVSGTLAIFFGPLGSAALPLEDEDGLTIRRARLILPGIVVGISAVVVLRALPGLTSWEAIEVPDYTPSLNGSEIAWAVVPGLVGAVAGVLLERLLQGGTLAARVVVPNRVLRAVVGGLGLGILGAISERLLFSGHSEISPLIQDAAALGAGALLLLALGKVVATSLCLSTGWFGGEIFPVVFAGVAAGLAVQLGISPLPESVAIVAGAAGATGAALGRPVAAALVIALLFPIDLAGAAIVGAVIGGLAHRLAGGGEEPEGSAEGAEEPAAG